MVATLADHKNQHTGDATLDRIQSNVAGVIAYLKSLVWVPNQAFVQLTADVSTTSTTFVDVLSTTIATALPSGNLEILLTASFETSVSGAVGGFAVLVDGVFIKATRGQSAFASGAVDAALVLLVPVKAGKHVVKVQWRVNSGSSIVRAQSFSDEGLQLLVKERP